MTETQSMSETNVVIPGTLAEQETRTEAARIFSERHSIIVDNASVFGIWIDGGNADELERIIEIKRRRAEQAYATSVPAEEFIPRIDPDRIHRSLWPLLEPAVFTEHFGEVTFVLY